MESIINEKIKFIYSETSSRYMNEVVLYFKDNHESVMQFFNKSSLNKPLVITIWDNKEEFKKEMSRLSGIEDIPDWSIGMANSKMDNKINRIDCLDLERIREISYHSDKTIDDMKKLVVHEFTHICCDEYTNYDENIPFWVQEGVAVYLSGQHDNAELTVPIDDIKNDNMVPYQNYRYIFNKVVDNYSKEEVLGLFRCENIEGILDGINGKAK